MDRTTLIRASALYLPLVTTAVVWLVWPPAPRDRAAAWLATGWNLAMLPGLHALALGFGWWSFAVAEATLAGFPVDLYLGWAVMWGTLPALLLAHMRAPLIVIGAIALDLVAMPGMRPVVSLGRGWLVGEAVAIAACLIPGIALATWTRTGAHVTRRAMLQAIAFSGLTLGVLPTIILAQSGGSWDALFARPRWVTSLLVQCVAALGLLGVSAVQEFATRGDGTPVPFDPPRRFVTSGAYRYVRNPMQLSATLVLVAWGAVAGSWWVSAAGAMAVIYGAGFAAGDETADLHKRFGARWQRYAALVRSWIPRWRPADLADLGPRATLYVAEECGPCSEVRRWFDTRRPVGLQIVAAELHPSRTLSRITYDPGDDTGDAEGVAAIGRALEHIHLGWALLGMFVRLPIVCQFLQLLTDASGGGERRVVRYCDRSASGMAVREVG
jgi:protein-S-isoprenylcysteine O-methyltransferase Ste14